MIRTLRLFLAVAALGAGSAHAQQLVQTQLGVSPVLEVQRLAPQLVQFAGGDVNFQNLVNGLSFGLPVMLTTSVAPGVTQVVSFTPSGTLTPLQIAQTLESARQVAIANGIATPTAQQMGVILNGGALPTALGSTPINGLIGGNPVSTAAASRTSPAATHVSDSPLPRGISDTPVAPPVSSTPTTGTTATAGATAPPRVMPGAGGAFAGSSAPTGTPRFGVAR